MKLLRILPTNPSCSVFSKSRLSCNIVGKPTVILKIVLKVADAMYLLADFSRIQWGEGENQPLTKKANRNGIMIWLSVKSLELESVLIDASKIVLISSSTRQHKNLN